MKKIIVIVILLLSANCYADSISVSNSSGKTLKYQEFLSSGTFTPSAGLLAAGGMVEIDLRGAGGAGAPGNVNGGGGGGGGSSRCLITTTVTAGAITVTIGASNSASSSFGVITCAGGGPGQTSLGVEAPGGGTSGGNSGMPGGIGDFQYISGNRTYGGNGGGLGGGAGAANVGQSGIPNSGGGGGGGGYDAPIATAGVGGNGASGYCLVKWWE